MNDKHQLQMLCQRYVNHPVQVQMYGHAPLKGLVEYADDENLYLVVPTDENGNYLDIDELMPEINAQHPYQEPMTAEGQRYYYPPYPPPYPYYSPYPPRPFGWNRLIIPLTALVAITALAAF